MRPRKGAYQENLGRLGEVFQAAAAAPEPPELIVAPETALTGYFLEGGVRDLALTADQLFHDLTCQHRDAKAPPLDIALGFYEVHQNRLFNSGPKPPRRARPGVRQVNRKSFTARRVDEERFVEAGSRRQALDTRWGRAASSSRGAWPPLRRCWRRCAAATHHRSECQSGAGIIRRQSTGGREPRAGERMAQDIAGDTGQLALAQLVGLEGGRSSGRQLGATPRATSWRGPVFKGVLTATLDFEESTRARGSAAHGRPRNASAAPARLAPQLGAAARAQAGAVPTGSRRVGETTPPVRAQPTAGAAAPSRCRETPQDPRDRSELNDAGANSS